MVHTDPQLSGIGQKRGLEIWRINKFTLEKLPEDQYGNFYVGDSYIILHTKNVGDWNVHFWLGSETSVDERGTAAIKTVELDDALGGRPVQYREVQNFESPLFLSYFKEGIRRDFAITFQKNLSNYQIYLQGGVSSGFTHVKGEYDGWKPRLFHCKGKRNIRCTQVDCSKESLNLGDVFILDCGLNLYVWMPPESGRLERIKGMEQARNIRDHERDGKPQIHVLDSDWDHNEDFNRILGCKKFDEIKPAVAGGSDENYWLGNQKQITLWRVSDETGTMKVSKVAQGNFQYQQLESKDAFILDAGNGGVYVWVGKSCTLDERKKAMGYAQDYIQQMNKPPNTRVTRVMEGAEPPAFTQWASTWESARKTPPFVPKLYQCGDSSGRLMIDEIADFKQQVRTSTQCNQNLFWDLDGDDVMLLDALNVIYVWIGKGANESEKKFAKNVAQKYLDGDAVPRPSKAAIQTINQGHEPSEFKKHFHKWDDNLHGGLARTVESVKKHL